jgi:hypothetical protein
VIGLWGNRCAEASGLRMCLAKKVLMFSAKHWWAHWWGRMGVAVVSDGCSGGVGCL